jgi:hypothetical protein
MGVSNRPMVGKKGILGTPAYASVTVVNTRDFIDLNYLVQITGVSY